MRPASVEPSQWRRLDRAGRRQGRHCYPVNPMVRHAADRAMARIGVTGPPGPRRADGRCEAATLIRRSLSPHWPLMQRRGAPLRQSSDMGDARAWCRDQDWPVSGGVLPHAQLFVYQFGPDSRFEGQLGGALQRLETGGVLRILEVMFIQREAETGELVVFDAGGDGAGSLIAPLLDFRLDPAARRRATERALEAVTPGAAGELARELGNTLEPGDALAVLLIEHRWADALDEAVARTGGVRVVGEFVEARTLAGVAQHVLSAANRPGSVAAGERQQPIPP
jgi:hypothetical protein